MRHAEPDGPKVDISCTSASEFSRYTGNTYLVQQNAAREKLLVLHLKRDAEETNHVLR